MIVTIHQPNLFPWLGFFDKMARSDLFILLDQVPFTKRGYQNRVGLKASNGAQWLTLPVESKGRFAQLTNTVKISGELPWQKQHLKTLELLYRKSANFDAVFPIVERLYAQSGYHTLSDFTIPGIEMMKDLMNITTPLIKASELNINGKSSELLSDLVKAVGGTVYLSGPSGRNYLDHSIFHSKGIGIDYHHYEMTPYPQRFGEFIGGLSALDYLFNVPQSENPIGAGSL